MPQGYQYLDTVDLCFHSQTEESSIVSALNDLLDENDRTSSSVEWINSAMLICPALVHVSKENLALSLASACCSFAQKRMQEALSPDLDVVLAGCKANLSLIQRACGKRREAVASADQAIAALDEARSRRVLIMIGDLANDFQRKRVLYTHARLLSLYDAGRPEDAGRVLDALFGMGPMPDMRNVNAIKLPHAHIGLLLLDRWKVYAKLQKMDDRSLRSLLDALCAQNGDTDSICILQDFLDFSDAEPRNYEDERLEASIHICDVLSRLNLKGRAIPETQRVVGLLRSAVEGGKVGREEDYGNYAMKLASMLNVMGRTVGSVVAAQEAAASRERLLKRDPNRKKYQMKLSQSYRKLADWQRRNKQFKISLVNIDRAVELSYRLTTKDPSNPKYRDEYVKSLSSLSESEAECEGYEDSAREHAFRALSVIDDSAGPELLHETKGERAHAHHIIAKRIAKSDAEQACAYLESAMKQYEVVLKEKYILYRAAEFAVACDKAAELQLKRNNKRQALAYAEKAVELDRELCKERPGLAWRLAKHLETNFECLMRKNSFQEASIVVSELVATRRGIQVDDPTGEHKMDVARALDFQAKCMWKLRQHTSAIEMQGEVLVIAQTEADRSPNDFSYWLYIFTMHLSNLQHDKGDNGAALESAQKGVAYAEAFVNKHRDNDVILEHLATGLKTVAERMIDLGQNSQAVHKLQYAATISTQLVSHHARKYQPLLLQIWDEEQKQLVALGRRQEAIDVLQLSIDTRRKRGRNARADIASALNQLSVQKSALGRKKDSKDALAASEEAVQITRKLIEEGKGNDLTLAIYLSNLGLRQADLKRQTARETLQEASTRLKPFLISSPNSVRESYKAVQDRLKELPS